MNLIERATIVHFHRHRMAEFGECSPKSLGWRGEESQRRRFDVIAAAGEFDGSSVLDVGCGRGDLKRSLDERFSGITYIGVDHVPEFIRQARASYAGAERTAFFERDFAAAAWPAVDYVVASGALGYRSASPAFHLDMIRKMYESARHAAIFNMLDQTVFPEHPLLVGRDRDEVVGYCRTLTPRVKVIDGYQEDDFTVCMRRG